MPSCDFRGALYTILATEKPERFALRSLIFIIHQLAVQWVRKHNYLEYS